MPATTFERQRERISQATGGQTQQSTDAMRRRFASLGMSSSGAAIQAEQQVRDRGAQTQASAMADVDAAEGAEMERRAEVGENRKFQAGEAQKGRDFEGGFRSREFDFNRMNADRQFGLAERQTKLGEDESAFNRRLAKYTAGNQGGFFGAGGFLGTGIGSKKVGF